MVRQFQSTCHRYHHNDSELPIKCSCLKVADRGYSLYLLTRLCETICNFVLDWRCDRNGSKPAVA